MATTKKKSKTEEETVDIAAVVKNANRCQVHRDTGIDLAHISRVLNARTGASMGAYERIADSLKVPAFDLYKYLKNLRAKAKAKPPTPTKGKGRQHSAAA